MRITVTKSGVTNEYGQSVAIGVTATVPDALGASWVYAGKATDTDGVLAIPVNRPLSDPPNPYFSAAQGPTTGIATAFNWAGAGATSAAAASNPIALQSYGPFTFTVTAGAGVTNAVVQVQAATNAALTSWVTLGVVSQIAPGSATLVSQIPYYGYRINVVNVTGGAVSATVQTGGNTTSSGFIANPTYTGIPTSGPQLLARSGVSILGPTSFTSGNNGAVTGMSAGSGLAAANPNGLWWALAAGAIYAGSPQGVYWYVPATDATGTIYNIILTPGQTPYVPTTLVPFTGRTGVGAVTGTAGSNFLACAILVPGGALGPNGQLRAEAVFSGPTVGNGVPALWYSTTAGGGTTLGTQWSAGTLNQVFIQKSFKNRGAQNLNHTVNTSVSVDSAIAAGQVPVLSTIDTSQNWYVQVSLNLSLAVNIVTLDQLTIEILPA